jgi:hypothetical protein
MIELFHTFAIFELPSARQEISTAQPGRLARTEPAWRFS